MKATVRAPGTCGELVQGTINGDNFHVTCPINCYSYVTVELTTELKRSICNCNLSKTIKAVDKTLDYLGNDSLKARIEVDSNLISEKGMASSTADITAAILATAVASGERITSDEIANLALSIEPTDGLFYEGIVLFDHVQGKRYRYLGEVAGIDILMLDLGGKVDTLDFNNRKDLAELNRKNEPETNRALKLAVEGIKEQNSKLIGRGATLSSQANQRILAKPHFNKLLQLTELQGVWGINVAHSGTLLGILHDSKRIETEALKTEVQNMKDDLSIYNVKLINGGLEIIESSFNQERKYQYG
ncbi:GHMP kinase [Acetohalobium arabaticum]|uniref:GHMP kinase n=1 Tax=Acetohalobium arabaticum (strain ATCC 49924 / DSM 5501 / Z-7288) TaxID=574087 RepID=D9QVX2_ACEAZ|nr:GHMP kinase [Acetohalobium arabaticum]ADL12381.1 GHMP kinase [Acetohalobium arabaticum DSM 5501]